MFALRTPLARSLAVVVMLLAGCDSGKDDTAHAEADADTDVDADADTGPMDADGDGWTVADGDCDDGNPEVHPAAVEDCDGVDDDCDGAVDEDFDTDLDGWTTCGGDCDDGDPDVHPDAGEATGDGVDQDCDGGDDCFVDADDDGYGTLDTLTSEDLDCTDPGESAFFTDCDDADPTVNPGVEEICDDGIDNDCDGGPGDCILSGEIDLSEADAILVGEDAEGEAGHSVAIGDTDGDGVEDILIGAPVALRSGTVYLLPGPVYGTIDLAVTTTTLQGEGYGSQAGDVIVAEDFDGDGISDVLVGAPSYGAGLDPRLPGAVYLVLSPLSGTVSLSTADAMFVGENQDDTVGSALAAGDVNADGLGDVLIASPNEDTGGLSAGAVYLIYGPASGTNSLSSADAKLIGEDTADIAGRSVGAGDMDGDGMNDVLVGAVFEDTGGTSSGAVYLLKGPVFGAIDLSTFDAILFGEDEYAFAGISLATGDSDGDGLDDVLVGSGYGPVGGTYDGRAYLVLGPVTGERSLSTSEAAFSGEDHNDYASVSLTTEDVDHDGFSDFVIGANRNCAGGSEAGAAYLIHGPASGVVDLGEADAKFIGENEGDWAGWAVAIGNVDGDGFGDILVGATMDAKYMKGPGSAYLFYEGSL